MKKLLAICIAIVISPAQEKNEPARFTSSTNLVVVDVYAHDKSGKPVTNRKKEVLTVIENGKPQAISVFELQRLDGELLPAIADQPKTLLQRNTPAPPPRELPQGPLKFQDRR